MLCDIAPVPALTVFTVLPWAPHWHPHWVSMLAAMQDQPLHFYIQPCWFCFLSLEFSLYLCLCFQRLEMCSSFVWISSCSLSMVLESLLSSALMFILLPLLLSLVPYWSANSHCPSLPFWPAWHVGSQPFLPEPVTSPTRALRHLLFPVFCSPFSTKVWPLHLGLL